MRCTKVWARTAWLLAMLCTGVVMGPAQAASAATPPQGFDQFVASLWPLAKAKGVSRPTFEAATRGLTFDPTVIEKTKKQAEFSKPIWGYLDTAVSANRIERGTGKAKDWSATLAKAEKQFGVDRYVILGVWGLETNFGGFSGDKSVIRSLATLAYARYRGTYFRSELIAALRVIQDGNITAEAMTGSWAGAMGQTQFMPTSFNTYAVDYDGDGRRDIWGSIPDAIGSTANYLKKHGWIAGETWGYEVILPSYSEAHASTGYTGFSTWAERGVTRADGGEMPHAGEAQLLMPAGARGPAFLVTKNFKVIKSYNNSTSYALGVSLLGDRIAGWGPLSGAWPVAEGARSGPRHEAAR